MCWPSLGPPFCDFPNNKGFHVIEAMLVFSCIPWSQWGGQSTEIRDDNMQHQS